VRALALEGPAPDYRDACVGVQNSERGIQPHGGSSTSCLGFKQGIELVQNCVRRVGGQARRSS
jgi:hypothetical protein